MPVGTFFFQATEAQAADLAAAISEHFGISVLLHGSVGQLQVSGTLKSATQDEALNALGFLLGVTYREDGGGVYLFGGDKVESLSEMPSYGLTHEQLDSILRDSGQVVADRVILTGDQVRNAQLRKALEPFGDRASLQLEILVLDLSDDAVERMGQWLEDLRVGLGYAAKSYEVIATGGLSGIPEGIEIVKGPIVDVRGKMLLEWLETEKGAKTRLREQVEILSGSTAEFTSGEIIERPIFVREPETGNDLVTRFERRTIGLQLEVKATAWENKWHLQLAVEDSSVAGGTEKETALVTERVLDGPDDSYRLLASFTREQVTRREWRFPFLPFLKRENVEKQNRNVMILARQLTVGPVEEPEFLRVASPDRGTLPGQIEGWCAECLKPSCVHYPE